MRRKGEVKKTSEKVIKKGLMRHKMLQISARYKYLQKLLVSFLFTFRVVFIAENYSFRVYFKMSFLITWICYGAAQNHFSM